MPQCTEQLCLERTSLGVLLLIFFSPFYIPFPVIQVCVQNVCISTGMLTISHYAWLLRMLRAMLDPMSILSWCLVPVKDTAPVLKLRDSSPEDSSLCPSMANISRSYTSACFPLFWQNFRISHSRLKFVTQGKSDMRYKRAAWGQAPGSEVSAGTLALEFQ